MYKKFFGLKENPFNVTPDPRYLYSTPHTEEALACLTYCIQGRKGFVLLTGDVGTGKTTLLNKMLEWLRQEQVATAFVFNPRLNTLQFLDYMMSDFGVNCETRLKSQVLVQLNHWLLERYRAGGTAVLIVDEAQNLSPEVLEEIRLLTNLETSTEKLLQIVLSGQQELELRLRQPEFRQLRQRITLRCKTHPLTLEETRNYVSTRLRVAGNEGRQIFTNSAIDAVHNYSEGIPRVINVICEDALINAFADQKPSVDRNIVETVAKELELDIYPPTAPPPEQVVDKTRVNEYSGTAYGLGAAIEPEEAVALDPRRKNAASLPQSREVLRPESRPRKEVTGIGTSVPLPPVSVSHSQSAAAKSAAGPVVVEPPRTQTPATTPASRQAVAPAAAGPAAPPRPTEPKTTKAPGETGLGVTKGPTPVVQMLAPTGATGRPAPEDEITQLLRPEATPTKAPATRPPVRQAGPTPNVTSRRLSPMFWAVIGLAVAVSVVGVFTFVELSKIRNGRTAAVESPARPQSSTPPPVAEKPPAPNETQAVQRPADVPAPAVEVTKGADATPKPAAEIVEAKPKPEAPTPASPPVSKSAPAAPRVGRLTVTANVPDASISIDGRTILNAGMPYTFPSLPVGTHRIVVSKPGHEGASGMVTVQEGSTANFNAQLAAPGGEINIATNPAGLGVSIDGGPFAPSPVQAVVPVGPHTYRIKLPGSRVYEGNFEMKNGAIITRRVDFAGGEWLPPGETQ